MRLYIRDRLTPVPTRPAGEPDLDTESDSNVTVATIIGLGAGTFRVAQRPSVWILPALQ